MIRALSWFCAEHYGVFNPGGESWQKRSPKVSVASEVLAVIGRPINYFSRMTTEARYCLCAAAAALDLLPKRGSEIGLLSGGSDGWIAANQRYFRDYVGEGRSLGRGNLFIYTLPTSVPGEVAIVLSLTGPCLFVQDSANPIAELIRSARQMIQDGEADAMLALWSDPNAAVCFAVEAGQDQLSWLETEEASPLKLAGQLRTKVQRA